MLRGLTAYLLLGIALAAPLAESSAQHLQTYDTPRCILHISNNSEQSRGKPHTTTTADTTLAIIEEIHAELSRIIRFEPENKVIVRVLNEQEFVEFTGAPSWTSAMFMNGEVILPLDAFSDLDLDDLKKTLRHEITHAFIAELTKFHAPAWADEGLAQLLEGKPNPLLGPALRRWISDEDEAMPFEWLNRGFTRLDSSIVPAAYAQSLFAVRSLINNHGMQSLLSYFAKLGEGVRGNEAFRLSFNLELDDFRDHLSEQIKAWASSDRLDP